MAYMDANDIFGFNHTFTDISTPEAICANRRWDISPPSVSQDAATSEPSNVELIFDLTEELSRIAASNLWWSMDAESDTLQSKCATDPLMDQIFSMTQSTPIIPLSPTTFPFLFADPAVEQRMDHLNDAREIANIKSSFRSEAQCQLCPNVFKDRKALQHHMQASHLGRLYLCVHCQRGYARKDALARHLRTIEKYGSCRSKPGRLGNQEKSRLGIN